jgi:hypothetical protein
LKGKLIVLLAFTLFILSSPLLAKGQDNTTIWRDEMNYQSADQLQAAGWTITHQAGVSFSGSAIILDGTQEDTAIHYSNHFPSGISNWKVEDRSRWTLGSHCGNSVTAVTDKHSYAFMADGWYGNFVFYRDGQKTTFGSFEESKNTWFTLAIEKQGNQINMYYNGEIKSTYTETDSTASKLIGADAVSPWRGGSEYDYFEVWQIGDTSTQEAQESLLSNPIVIGGIIGAVGVGVGGVLYFFVLGGGGATGNAAGGAGAAGSTGGSQGGGGSGSDGEEQGSVLHPVGGGTLIHPPGSVQNTQTNTLNEVATSDTGEKPPAIPNSTEMQSGETLFDAADKPNNSGLHTEAQDTLTQLMNQSQQNVPDRLQTNSETVTQQTSIQQESVVNVVATPGQNTPQVLDKVLKPKTDANKSTTDSG